MISTIATCASLALAGVVCLLNWGYLLANHRRKRQGSKRNVSTIPLVAQVLVLLAASINRQSNFPAWVFWAISFSDPALYLLLFSLVKKSNGKS